MESGISIARAQFCLICDPVRHTKLLQVPKLGYILVVWSKMHFWTWNRISNHFTNLRLTWEWGERGRNWTLLMEHWLGPFLVQEFSLEPFAGIDMATGILTWPWRLKFHCIPAILELSLAVLDSSLCKRSRRRLTISGLGIAEACDRFDSESKGVLCISSQR